MKFLTKRNIIIAVSVLILLAVTIPLLLIEPWNTTELTDQKREELIASLEARENGMINITPGTQNNISNGGYYYYYGTYNGFDVIFERGDMTAISVMRVGDEAFYYSEYFSINLHSNGRFISLEDAYKQGLISPKNLRKIAQMHYDRVARYISARDVYRELGFGERYEK